MCKYGAKTGPYLHGVFPVLVKLDLSFNCVTVKSMTAFAEAIQENKCLHIKLACLFDIYGEDALKFNLTILQCMYMNKTIMKLNLPGDKCVSWNKQSVCNEVEKINQERTKSGVDVFLLILISTS